MRKLIFAIVILSIGMAFAQDTIVPVEQDPVHKVVFTNEYVEVIRAILLPGGSTFFHSHSHARAAVNLSDAKVREVVPDKKPQTLAIHAGSITVQDYDKQPFVHSMTNIGKDTFEALDIELLKRPDGLPTEALSSPAAENAAFRAYKWSLKPGASTPQHTHARPYLIIAVSKMQLSMTAPGGEAMEHPVKPGDFHWIDSKVTHTLTNKGKEAGTIIEIELR